MSFDKYFTRQDTNISLTIDKKFSFFVVIPVFADELIFATLESLEKAYINCKLDICVIVVINHSISATDKEKEQNLYIHSIINNCSYGFPIHLMFEKDIPEKVAGVGFARKTGMDLAAYHFYENDLKEGIIISLDADTTVATNYFTAIDNFFKENPKAVGANIYFEHPIKGTEFEKPVYDAAVLYEIHLRYFIQALRQLNYPWAYHTIGSAFTVKAKNYVAAQGISKRQGGEDFYFLNKIFVQGQFGEINDTCVYPSPRPNNKTPFGTGIAIKKIINQPEMVFETYALANFMCIEALLRSLDKLWKLDFKSLEICESLMSFLNSRNFFKKTVKIKVNSSSFKSFKKSFYRLFDTFEIIKFLNEVSSKDIYKKQSVILEANKLLKTNLSDSDLLYVYREIQKNTTYLSSYQQ